MFRLKDFRVAHELYQSQMAEILGLNQSNVSRIETSGLDLSPSQYKRLVQKYGEEEVEKYNTGNANVISNNKSAGDQTNQIINDNNLIKVVERQLILLERQQKMLEDAQKTIMEQSPKIMEIAGKLAQ